MAALKWLVHSACNVLGYPKENSVHPDHHQVVGYSGKGQFVEGDSLKGSSSTLNNNGGSFYSSGFQMPLHYPRYTKADYEKMEEGKVDLLLKQYGLCFDGNLDEKRAFAMGAFLWPDQY
ncbi:hypothetical protein UlMin_016594 [Ulmus minor]